MNIIQLWHDWFLCAMTAISDSRHWLMPLIAVCCLVIIVRSIVLDVRDEIELRRNERLTEDLKRRLNLW
jgi:cellobiose-specific phosphotransferase system component IIC